jgi:hypothetical protein
LPGCWSQGETEDEALENIKDAIWAYLETIEELNKDSESSYVEVGSWGRLNTKSDLITSFSLSPRRRTSIV